MTDRPPALAPFEAMLGRNVQALAAHNPAAAKLLSAQTLPSHWTPAVGSDGTATLAVHGPESVRWAGGTSMPRASAGPLVATLAPGQTNGLGIGIGSGHEWLAMLQRLAPHQMLFVLETDLEAARVALSICDWSEHLASGRIALLLGDGAGLQLAEFLQTFEGVDPPVVIHPLPTLEPAQRAALLGTGETLIRQAVTDRANKTAARSAALAAVPAGEWAQGSPAVLFFIHPRHVWEKPGHTLAPQVAEAPRVELGDYRQAGRLYRLGVLEHHRPAVIYSDVSRGQLGPEAPPQAPVCLLVPPGAGASYWQALAGAEAPRPRDRAICHATAHVRELSAVGYAEANIAVIPLGVTRPEGETPAGERRWVALVADLPQVDAEAYGLELPTHKMVWNAAAELLFEDPLAVHEGMIADLFRRAQARAGVELKDPQVIEPMRRAVWQILARSVVNLGVAVQLAEAGVPVKLIGEGWNHPRLPASVARVPFPINAADASAVWGEVAIVLQVDAAGVVHPAVPHAAAHGVAIAAAEHPSDHAPAGIAKVFQDGKQLLRLNKRQLVPGIKALLADKPRREAMAKSVSAAL